MTAAAPLLFSDIPSCIRPPGSGGELERCDFRIASDLLIAPVGCGKTAAIRRFVERLELSGDLAVVEDTREDWSR